MRPVTVLDVLLEAAVVLDAPDRYTPIAVRDARDIDGDPCGFTTDRAYAFTLLGACKLAVRRLGIAGHRDRTIAYAAMGVVGTFLAGAVEKYGTSGGTRWRADYDDATYPAVIEAIDHAILWVYDPTPDDDASYLDAERAFPAILPDGTTGELVITQWDDGEWACRTRVGVDQMYRSPLDV